MNLNTFPPLISCLCVTRGRPSLLRRAIACFHAQSYRNKELIIVYESDDIETCQYLDTISFENIRKVEVSVAPKVTLGRLRNISIQEALGEYIAQWDDDDWSDPDRLKSQMKSCLGNSYDACVLTRWVIYDEERRAAYVSSGRGWEGSIVCKKTSLPPYPDLARGEDTPVLEQLFNEGKVIFLDNPELYVYVYHKNNTWDRTHWETDIINPATLLPLGGLELVEDVLNLSQY